MPFEVSVPIAAGVPSVVRPPGFASDLALLASDLIGLAFGQEVWGIYLDGVNVVTADTVVSFDYRQDWAISDAQIEQGGFQSYDKVQIPYDARVRFASGGTEVVRSALLESIAAIAGTLTLFDVVTPTAVYSNASIVHHDYRRSNENGRSLLLVDVWLQEVRLVQSSSLTSTAAPSGADAVNGGNVQPSAPLGQGGIGSDTAASASAASAAANFTPVTTVGGSGGIGSA